MSVGFSNSVVEVVKPAVYRAANKVNNYFKRAVRKGTVSKEDAVGILSHVFDCVFKEHTEAFEQAVNKAKSPEDIISLFDKVTIKIL